MGILFGREKRQWAPEPIVPPYPGWTSNLGAVVTGDQAMAISTVWGCVGQIANSVALMPLQTFTGSAATEVPSRVNDPRIVSSPQPGLTQSEFVHQVMVSLLLRGNCYASIVDRDSRMRPTALQLLSPDAVRPRQRDDGTLVYVIKGEDVPSSQIWHVRGMTMPGSQIGMSPVAYGASQMGIELSAAKFGKDFFDGGGVPKAVLQSTMEITKEQARELKDRARASTMNREPLALGSGVEYKPISVRPDESQFVATLQNAVAMVARFFFMPPEMVGGSSGASMTYANREQRAIDYATYTVSPWLKRLEDAWFPLLPQPQYVRFDAKALLRTDAETQAKVDAIRIASKVLPPSRVLSSMDEKPLTEPEKQELELVPLTINASTGSPKSLPNPPTPATSDDTPNVAPNLKVVGED